ncbi:MAG: hypothetical protein LBI42_02350 [Chitinispirillales bacterium]|jgi:hypothetical protein|nr:hypothetical protein [Chitinispirillales bacterium]
MQKKSNSLDHAFHNEKVCKYLNKKSEFADWVITTAFYSALHFLRGKLFPLEFGNGSRKIEIVDFDDYCIKNGTTAGKHETLSNLVGEHLPELYAHYSKLKSLSWTARYNCYEYDRDLSNHALEKLELIKNGCGYGKLTTPER